ncbi:hypothetical protein P3L10_032522 [Capsicum annuum]
MNNSQEHSFGVVIINVSDRNSVDRILRTGIAGNLQNRSAQYWRNLPYYSQSARDPFELSIRSIHDQEAWMEDVTLAYFKTRTHDVKSPKKNKNNPNETLGICVICHMEYEHEETIGILGCKHEYHAGCIKQWLLRKKDCPICRASVCPFTSTKATK